LPVLFVGLGEQPEDLAPFDPQAFLDGILAPL
jgi:signal recognition particle GTPase